MSQHKPLDSFRLRLTEGDATPLLRTYRRGWRGRGGPRERSTYPTFSAQREVPMTAEAKRLLEAALQLPEAERADLAARLLESINPPTALPAGWEEEVRRRVQDLDQGRVKTVPWAEARRRIVGGPDGPPER